MKLTKLPGLIDPHVHLRDPGVTHKEDFETGTKAAVAGGFVAILDMPNNPIPTVTKETLDEKKKIAQEKAVCDYGLIFGASARHPEFISGSSGRQMLKQVQHDNRGNTNEFPKVYDDVPALKVYMDSTTGNLLLEKQAVLERTFQLWQSQKPIIVHAEGETMNKAIDLAKKFGRKLHIAHLSQKSELERVILEKENGMPITCEVTPHHLFLTEKDVKQLGPYGLMKPPLRKQSDVDFLWNYIDAIDCIATDHAPHTKEEKVSNNPPYGVPGLETSLPLLLTAAHEGRIELEDVIRLMHYGPKSIFSLPISNFSFIEVDLNSKFLIHNSNLFTKCGWSPFDGMTVYGKVVSTTIRGTKVYNGEEVLASPGFGRNLYE